MAKSKKQKSEVSATNPDKDAIDHVITFKEESVEYYKDKFKKFLYFDRLYIKGASKTNVPYGRANLELPLVFQQVEPFVAQMTETMVGEAPYIAYQGRTLQDEDAAEAITDYTQYQLEQGGFMEAQSSFFRNLAKYGTAVMKVNWEVDTVDVDEPLTNEVTGEVLLDEQGQPATMPEPRTLHDGPRYYNVSIFDFFVPKGATTCNVQRLDGVVHRTWRDPWDLLKNPNYKNKKHIRALINGEPLENSETPIHSNQDVKREQLSQDTEKGSEKFSDKCEVLEYWGNYSKEKDTPPTPYLIVVAIVQGEPILLRCDPNPFKYKFKPFVAANDYPIEGEFYGYGEIDHIKGLVEESTALRNARLDVANQSLNGMWLVERQAGINLRELYSAPNKIILTNDLNGIKPLQLSGVTPSSVQELARIDFDIQNTTEIINPRQDVSNVGAAFGGTATGVNFMSAKSNLRLLMKARLLEQTYFKPLGILMLMMNRDMVTDEAYFRVTDNPENPWTAISPDAFASEVDFKPTSNPQKLSVDERKSNINYLMQVIAQFVKVYPVNVDGEFLLKEVCKIAGFPHPEKIVKPAQTTIMYTPDGQLVDQKGQPVQLVQVDEQGNPLPPMNAPMDTGAAVPAM